MGLFNDKDDDELKQPITKQQDVSPSNGDDEQQHKKGKKYRKADRFQGRNTLCCHGRVVMAKSLLAFVVTLLLILVPSILFFIFDAPYLWKHVHQSVPLIQATLFFNVMSNLFHAAFTDPGIVPPSNDKRTDEEEFYIRKEAERAPRNSEEDTIKSAGGKSAATSLHAPSARVPVMKSKTIYIGGDKEVDYKWCYTCRMWRPPRASHCSSCNNCIEDFDHHCPWVGNCVGKRNYRFFYQFLLATVLLTLFSFCAACVHIALLAEDEGTVNKAIQKSPTTIVVLVICFGSFFAVLGMLIYHTYLIALHLTTAEEIKGFWSPASKKRRAAKSPFSKGNCCKNLCAVLCGPRHPRVLKLERPLDEEDQEEEKVRRVMMSSEYGSTARAQPLPPPDPPAASAPSSAEPSSKSASVVASTGVTTTQGKSSAANNQELGAINESNVEENADGGDEKRKSYEYVMRSDMNSEPGQGTVPPPPPPTGQDPRDDPKNAQRSSEQRELDREGGIEEASPPNESGVTAKSEPHVVSGNRNSTTTEPNVVPRQSLDQRYSLTSSTKSAGGAAVPGGGSRSGRRKRSDVPSIKLSAQNSLDPTIPSSEGRINSPDKLYPDYEPEDDFWDEEEEFEDYSSTSDSTKDQVEIQIQRNDTQSSSEK